MTSEPGDSVEQREAEDWLLGALSKQLGTALMKQRWSLDGGSWIEVDGYCQSPKVLCEIWAHIGPPKSAQKYKVMTDALKLIFVSSLTEGVGRCILLFSDHDAASFFQRTSWMAQCLAKYGIEVRVIELPPNLKNKVIYAQQRQYR